LAVPPAVNWRLYDNNANCTAIFDRFANRYFAASLENMRWNSGPELILLLVVVALVSGELIAVLQSPDSW